MYIYSVPQWVILFYIYCFVGWVIESTVVSIKSKKFINRGFMRGPFLPIYGTGAILALFATLPVRDNYILIFIFGSLTATILEYFTGEAMEKLFGVRYWDYRYKKIQFRGHICFETSIVWGFLIVLLVKVIHRPIENLILMPNGKTIQVIAFIFTIYFVFDFAVAFREAIQLKDIMKHIEKAKDELQRAKRRTDIVIAFASDDINQRKEAVNYYIKKVVSMNKKMLKRLFVVYPTLRSEKFKAVVEELKERLNNEK